MPEPIRLGPRPLLLHLQQAALAWGTAAAAGPLLATWLARPGAGETLPHSLRHLAAAFPADRLGELAYLAGRRRLGLFLEGLRAYWHHPCRRSLPEPPAIWSRGAARLLDYGPDGAPAVLVVPSLVNRAYILDLAPQRSLMRALSDLGLRPLLLDWGAPGEVERDFGLDGYVAGHLDRALDALLQAIRRPPAVIGYCMGGLLALALAARRPADLAGLALLATPWDFHAGLADPAALRARVAMPAGLIAQAMGELPVVVLQALFAMIEPLQVPRKFVRFAGLDQDSAEAAAFVLIEDWLNDGVPLASRVARECLLGWYGDNLPGRGLWSVAGTPVLPERIALPTLVAFPARDRIVPPESAGALARALPAATVLRPQGGHIGMVVGARAGDQLWRPLASWLRQIAALQEKPSPRRRRGAISGASAER